jgi:hypothetical protein
MPSYTFAFRSSLSIRQFLLSVEFEHPSRSTYTDVSDLTVRDYHILSFSSSLSQSWLFPSNAHKANIEQLKDINLNTTSQKQTPQHQIPPRQKLPPSLLVRPLSSLHSHTLISPPIRQNTINPHPHQMQQINKHKSQHKPHHHCVHLVPKPLSISLNITHPQPFSSGFSTCF